MKFRFAVFTLTAGAAFAAAKSGADAPTFSKDIAPILNQRCVECHRAGEAAPMPLGSYKEARPWAKSIKQAVVSRTMPPWSADPAVGHFKNSRRLSDTEVAAIVKWVDTGAPEGNPKDLPKAPGFVAGWNIVKNPNRGEENRMLLFAFCVSCL